MGASLTHVPLLGRHALLPVVDEFRHVAQLDGKRRQRVEGLRQRGSVWATPPSRCLNRARVAERAPRDLHPRTTAVATDGGSKILQKSFRKLSEIS